MKAPRDVKRLNKARRIAHTYRMVLLELEYGTPEPPYFSNYVNRILQIDYLIIDLKYKK